VVEKAMAKGGFFSFIYLFILWFFWFNALELKINNDGGFFFAEG
jgi:hypothetical protein